MDAPVLAWCCQVVRHRTRLKNEVHAILHAHLIAKFPHVDLFNRHAGGRANPLPDNERVAISVVGKFAMLCWHMLNKEEDDLWTHRRSAPTICTMTLQPSRP